MKKCLGISLLLWVPLLLAATKMPPAPKNTRAAEIVPEKAGAPPARVFPNGVTMREQVYTTLPGFRPLRLDLYLPPGKDLPRPGLIFVHGGGWAGGDARHGGTFADFPGLLATLAARGYVVAGVNYRLSGEARFPGALRDVKSAIRWLRLHADDFNLDSTRLAVWGMAAGGELAALAGVSCGVASLEPVTPVPSDPAAAQKPVSDCVQAVIDWYGITNFESLSADLGKDAPDKSDAGAYLGCEPALCPTGFARSASPLAYIQAMNPPFLIQHGAADTVVSPKQSQALYDALHAAGVPAQLVLYPAAGHNFVRVTDGAADPGTNKRAIEKIEAFLDATFPKKPMAGPYKPVKRKGLGY